MSENTTVAIDALTAAMLQINDTFSLIQQALIAITCLAVLVFFTWLTLKVDSSWGSPILALVTAGVSLMLGFYGADIIDGQYSTTGYGLVFSVALIVYAFVCIAWSWGMMFKNRED